MKTLRLYILREHVGPFIFSLAIFVFVLLTGNMFKLMEILARGQVAFIPFLKLVVHLLPLLISYALPMAFLSSILMTLGTLSEENEITAMRASGVGLKQLLSPILIIAILLSSLSLFLNSTLLPRASFSTRCILKKMGGENPLLLFQKGVFVEEFKDYIFHVEKVKGNFLQSIHCWKLSGEGPPSTITAREGMVFSRPEEGTVTILLLDGREHSFRSLSEDPNQWKHYPAQFERKSITLKIPTPGRVKKRRKDMSFVELRAKMDEFRGKGIDPSPLLAEIDRRRSISFAPLAFALIGLPLGIRLRRGGRSLALGLSLPVILAYYLLLVTGVSLAEKGSGIPFLIWSPNLFLGGIGAYLLWRT